jgi:hypothetical protein
MEEEEEVEEELIGEFGVGLSSGVLAKPRLDWVGIFFKDIGAVADLASDGELEEEVEEAEAEEVVSTERDCLLSVSEKSLE